MKHINVVISDEAKQLLKNIIWAHEDLLFNAQAGESWQPSELKLTNELIEAFILPHCPKCGMVGDHYCPADVARD